MRRDAGSASLGAPERALVSFAVDLTRHPGGPSRPRVDGLRAAGFDDAAILSATQVTAYFNFVNRMAHGLGVELEEAPG